MIEDDVTQLWAMANLVSPGEVTVTAVSTGSEALAALDRGHFECVVVDLGLPDIVRAGDRLARGRLGTPIAHLRD